MPLTPSLSLHRQMLVCRPPPPKPFFLPGGSPPSPLITTAAFVINLGCPAGTLEYLQREATTKASRPLPAVHCLPSWSALPLIRSSILPPAPPPTSPNLCSTPTYDGIPFLPAAGTSWVEQIWEKLARYRPVLGDLAADPDHLAIILLVAATTGRLSDPAMKLLKSIVQEDSPSRTILNHFCTYARYNAVAAHVWVGGGGYGLILPHDDAACASFHKIHNAFCRVFSDLINAIFAV